MQSMNRPELVKEHNLNLVRQALFREREATRQQLSALTGISNVTMGGLLNQLLEDGEALCLRQVQPASGRPAQVFCYNARRKYGLLVYMEQNRNAHQLNAKLVDLFGETVWEESSPADGLSDEESAAYFQRLLTLYEPVASVGIGLPGIGFGEYFREDKCMRPLSLKAINSLTETAGLLVQTENDVNLAAMGYAWRRQIPAQETFAYIYLMQGSYGGSAVWVTGKLHLGKDRFAGEFPPHAYGANWSVAHELPCGALQEQLFTLVISYLTILAPHQIIFASDYLDNRDMAFLTQRTCELFGERHCPLFRLTEHFDEDYHIGLKRLTLSPIEPAAHL